MLHLSPSTILTVNIPSGQLTRGTTQDTLTPLVAPIIELSNKFGPTVREVINIDDKNENTSAISNLLQLSNEELTEHLKNL